ncbi:hypothetical protein [Nocardia sp. NPDC047654]|uniref:hypothetical protein n=1 Tax=Nocardia sp. NPDC047654 TaxID=3364314 RepID=UPI00371E7ABF
MASDVRSSVADHRADTRSQCRTGLAGVVVSAVGATSRVYLEFAELDACEIESGPNCGLDRQMPLAPQRFEGVSIIVRLFQ